MKYLKKLFVIWLILCSYFPAFAQMRTQTLTLNPGWNAVYFEVQPQPEQSEIVFQGLPVKSVWAWNRQFSSVQFIEDMNTIVPERPEWLTYFSKNSGQAFLTNLFKIQGGKAYLINIDSPTPVTLTINGTASLPSFEWMQDSFNLAGFNIKPDTITVKQFFSHSSAHKNQPVYQLDKSGSWNLLDESAFIQPGESYWVYSKGTSTYYGTCFPVLEQGKSLDFGTLLNEQVLRIINFSATENTIKIQTNSSEISTKRKHSVSTNSSTLKYFSDAEQKWLDFSDTLSITIPPNSETAIRFGANIKNSTTRSNEVTKDYLNISDLQGTYYNIPISVNKVQTDKYGLWLGTAIINKVSCPSCKDETTPVETGSEFQMRLIIHVDETGQARLLQQVTLLWKPGTVEPDSENPDLNILKKPGEYVLITDDSLINEYSGSAVRDNKLAGRRLSSAAFSFPEPIPMTGTLNSKLRCSITIDEDAPLNPFKHKFHPDHDNLNAQFKPFDKKNKTFIKESYTFVRNINLTFTTVPLNGVTESAWGTTLIGGEYRETIEGVHRKDIYVEGIFELRLISCISRLNDGK